MTSSNYLSRTITGFQYFTLAFGSIVGVAWIMIFGDLVAQVGPGGTVLALLLGGLLIVAVGFCYAEMAARRPAAGGELVYGYELLGPVAGYLTGCALALIYVAICAFEAISLAYVLEMLFPGFEGKALYSVLGADVTLTSIAAGVVMTLVLAALNIRGTQLTARAQEVITFIRLALMTLFIAVAFAFGQPANLHPLIGSASGALTVTGFLGVLMTAPVWYAGFSVFATATEERAETSTPASAGWGVVGGILGAILFYCLLIVSISMLMPWKQLTSLPLPAANAFREAIGSNFMTKTVLVAAVLGNLTAWNAVLIAGSRVLFAMGRARFFNPALGALSPRFRTPVNAILLITSICTLSVFLGRGVILPILNIVSAGFAVTYLITCLALLKLRRTQGDGWLGYQVPGGNVLVLVAALGSIGILLIALIQPAIKAGGIPSEWMVIGGWALACSISWYATKGLRASISPEERWRILSAEDHHATTRDRHSSD